jgi:RNA polymerase sigma-70 factor (ECF subfamily)
MKNASRNARLGDWFRQWRSPLRRFLVGRGAVRVADVDDVAQEVFMRLLRYDRAELVENPQAYVFKMASNVAAEWAIRARHVRPHDAKWVEDLLAEDQPELDVGRALAVDEIERALQKLAPRQRQVLKLQFTEGLGQAQIAQRIGATPRTVKRILAKSYAALRHELDAELLGVIAHGRE